jgi:hypothetical protein
VEWEAEQEVEQWYPGKAGQVKKSGHILMKGDKPCKVIDIKVSKTGKHGHGKCYFTAIDIFDGSKHEVRDSFPETQQWRPAGSRLPRRRRWAEVQRARRH